MKTDNLDPSGRHALDAARGRSSTNRAGSRGIRVIDALGNEVEPVTTLRVGTVLDLSDDEAQIGTGGAGGGSSTVYSSTASGSSINLDLSSFTVFDITLTANCTLSFTNLPTDGIASIWIFIIRQPASGGPFTVTWSATVEWQESDGSTGGSAPSLFTAAGAVDVFHITSLDGGYTYGGASLRGDHRLLHNLTSGDPHTQYVLETSTPWVDLTDGGETTLHSHAGGAGIGPLLLASDHPSPIVFDDILQASDGSDFLYASES